MYVHEIYIEHMKLIAEKIFDIFQWKTRNVF
jgi:hypothetical protein